MPFSGFAFKCLFKTLPLYAFYLRVCLLHFAGLKKQPLKAFKQLVPSCLFMPFYLY
jgi:hypothetical protein